MRSSTSRKRRSRSISAATVTSGFQTMGEGYRAPDVSGRRLARTFSSAACDPHFALFDHARLPDGIEFLQVLARDRGIVEAGDALGTIGTQAVNNRPVIGDAVRCGEFAILRRADADLEVTGEPMCHGDETIGAAAQARLIAHQHPHLGEAVSEYETFDDLEHRSLIVDLRLQVGRHDRDQPLAAGGNRFGRRAYLIAAGEHVQRFGRRPPFGEHGGRYRAVFEPEARQTRRSRRAAFPGASHSLACVVLSFWALCRAMVETAARDRSPTGSQLRRGAM